MIEPHDRQELERNTLRLLCAEQLDVERRRAVCRRLQPELFRDPIHRVLFEEICALSAADALRLRELLPAKLTNRGFPDAELEIFLNVETSAPETLAGWFRSAEWLVANRP